MPLVLGVDSSTQSTKVELRDVETGTLAGGGRAPHPSTTPPRSEQEPTAWWDALRRVTAVALAESRATGTDVVALSVAGQQHGLVVLDDHERIIRPAKLWNDTESAPDARLLVDAFGGPAGWAEACGSVPLAAFTIAKLAWLHRCEPEAFNRVAHVLLPHDWLTFRLTGRHRTDRGDASGTGYWSPTTGTYRFDLLRLIDDSIDWPAAVPEVLGPFEPAGSLGAEAAEALGLAAGTIVAPGTGDNMAGALGVGLATGEVAVSIGTSGTVFAVSERPTADPSGSVAGFADATGRFLPLVCTLNATKVTSAVASLLGVDLRTFDLLALEAAIGADGLVLLPYLDGERTPDRPDATGTLAGIRTDVRRETLSRAAFEGVVCGLLDGLDALVDVGGAGRTPTRLVLLGGGARSPAYRQILADLGQSPVTVPALDEPAAAGACVQAAAVATGRPPLDVVDRWGLGAAMTVEPAASAAQATAVRRTYATVRDGERVLADGGRETG